MDDSPVPCLEVLRAAESDGSSWWKREVDLYKEKVREENSRS